MGQYFSSGSNETFCAKYSNCYGENTTRLWTGSHSRLSKLSFGFHKLIFGEGEIILIVGDLG